MNARIKMRSYLIYIFLLFLSASCSKEKTLELKKGAKVALIGNNLGSRMMEYGLF